jgi:hypothetical protein
MVSVPVTWYLVVCIADGTRGNSAPCHILYWRARWNATLSRLHRFTIIINLSTTEHKVSQLPSSISYDEARLVSPAPRPARPIMRSSPDSFVPLFIAAFTALCLNSLLAYYQGTGRGWYPWLFSAPGVSVL